MALLSQIYAYLSSNTAALAVTVLLGISEALALIPQIKANSVFQLIYNSLSFVKNKLLPAK